MQDATESADIRMLHFTTERAQKFFSQDFKCEVIPMDKTEIMRKWLERGRNVTRETDTLLRVMEKTRSTATGLMPDAPLESFDAQAESCVHRLLTIRAAIC